MSRTFSARDATIYRPYPDEIPWELLLEADPDERRVMAYTDPDLIRVAKYEGVAIGAYVIRPQSDIRTELCTLVVARPYRHAGLGRWLLGHAIGLTETSGGREIFVAGVPLRGLFARAGFVEVDGGLLFTLTPE